jgi:hypothetical protein
MKRKHKLATIPATGTVTTYERDGDELKVTLHGRSGMEKQPRPEHESSDDPSDLEKQHNELSVIDCRLKGKFCYVEITWSVENGKNYTKLLYLKLAKWCKNHGYRYLIGWVVNEDAIPVFLRYNIPNTTQRIWLENPKSLYYAQTMGFKFHKTLFEFKNKMWPELDDPSSLNREQMAKLIPLWIQTEIH